MYVANFEATNKADWVTLISAVDADTGEDIDFTDASVKASVKDADGCERLTATVGNGITLQSSTVLQLRFTAAQMKGLCAGEYKIGIVYQIAGDDEIIQLLTGDVTVQDGVASL